jgi:hypothetical protein
MPISRSVTSVKIDAGGNSPKINDARLPELAANVSDLGSVVDCVLLSQLRCCHTFTDWMLIVPSHPKVAVGFICSATFAMKYML